MICGHRIKSQIYYYCYFQPNKKFNCISMYLTDDVIKQNSTQNSTNSNIY